MEQKNRPTAGFFRSAAVLIFFGILSGLLYAPAANGPFVLDDYANIVEKNQIHMTRLSVDSIMDAGLRGKLTRRPVANISFALSHLVHGLNPFWYRIENIIIHILASFFLFLLFKTTLRLPCFTKPGSDFVAFFAALIFLVHPINTQAVSYIVQRMTSMAAMFYILTMLFYVRGRIAGQRKNSVILYFFSSSCFFLAIGSKEIALTLPIMILLYEWFFLQDLKREWIWKNRLWFGSVAVLFGAAVLIFLYSEFADKIFSDYSMRDFSMYERVLTQFRVVIFYIGLLFFPSLSRMNLDHDFLVSTSFTDPVTTLLCAVIISGLFVWAILNAKKHRLICFAILWFFGNLVFESSFFPLELVFEHRIYLPSMFLCLAFVYLFSCVIKKSGYATVILCLIVVLLCAVTYQRNFIWASEIAIMKDCVEKSPAKARSNSGYARALEKVGRKSEAIVYFQRALKIDPECYKTHNNLGELLTSQAMFEKGLKHINTSISINPDNPKAYLNAGQAYMALRMLNDAALHFKTALKLDPQYAMAYGNLALVFAESGDMEQAMVYMSKAIRLDPKDYTAHLNYAKMLLKQGKPRQAFGHMVKAGRLKPYNPTVRYNMGKVLAYMGKTKEALEQYRIALQFSPDSVIIKKAISHISESAQK